MDLVVPSKILRKMRDRQIEKTGEKKRRCHTN